MLSDLEDCYFILWYVSFNYIMVNVDFVYDLWRITECENASFLPSQAFPFHS